MNPWRDQLQSAIERLRGYQWHNDATRLWASAAINPLLRFLIAAFLSDAVVRVTLIIAKTAISSTQHVLVVLESALAFMLLSVLWSRRPADSGRPRYLSREEELSLEADRIQAIQSTTDRVAPARLFLRAVRTYLIMHGDSEWWQSISELEAKLNSGNAAASVVEATNIMKNYAAMRLDD